jgi:hypothetical protein
MNHIISFTAGIIVTLIGVTYLLPAQTHSEQIVETRIITNEVLTTIDLEELKEAVTNLDQELQDECSRVLQRTSDLPEPAIKQYVDRHYDGDTCLAADQVWSRGW